MSRRSLPRPEPRRPHDWNGDVALTATGRRPDRGALSISPSRATDRRALAFSAEGWSRQRPLRPGSSTNGSTVETSRRRIQGGRPGAKSRPVCVCNSCRARGVDRRLGTVWTAIDMSPVRSLRRYASGAASRRSSGPRRRGVHPANHRLRSNPALVRRASLADSVQHTGQAVCERATLHASLGTLVDRPTRASVFAGVAHGA